MNALKGKRPFRRCKPEKETFPAGKPLEKENQQDEQEHRSDDCHRNRQTWEQPGPGFGAIIESAYEAQLEGEFENLDEALSWLGHKRATTVSPETIEKLRARLAHPTAGGSPD